MSSVKLNEEEKRLLHNAWHHFLTITHHKLVVMEGCFKVGLFKQGLLHDLSKYSWEEFKTGVKYYQGTRSPNAAEKEEKGYSSAWLHHKGRNKHHFEYWTDVSTAEDHWKIVGVKMPVNYLAEMVMDRIAERTTRTRRPTHIFPEIRNISSCIRRRRHVWIRSC